MFKKFLKALGSFLKELLKGSPNSLKPAKTANEKLIRAAAAEIGVKEVQGSGNNKRVVEYSKYATLDNKKGQADSVPWCSSFLCFLVETSLSIQSTNSMMARSWLKFGKSSKNDKAVGDIVVFWRGSKQSWKGHTGIYLGETQSYVYCLGGNQDDQVKISKYLKSKVLDYRRVSTQENFTQAERRLLNDLAKQLIAGKDISEGGKVV